MSATMVRVGLVLIMGCAAPATTLASPRQSAEWTVMVYMSGDNDLEKYIVLDLEQELAATGSSDAVQVVALADRGPDHDTSRGDWQSTKLFHVEQGMIADSEHAMADWGERNMGDPRTLIDFVTWARDNYPAKHFALYFWGHGWNWHPGYVMYDATDHDALDLNEITTSFPEIGFIDFVGYDGCNMAAIEVETAWQGHAAALAHSQEWVGWDGVEYDQVLAQLSADPSMTADDVAVATSQGTFKDKTWSAVAVDDRLDALLTAVDEWSLLLLDRLPQNRRAYKRAFKAAQSFYQAPMDKDLFDAARNIQIAVDDPQLSAACQAVMDAVDAVVLYERHRNKYDQAHGITVYLPLNHNQRTHHSYYESLDFCARTHWAEFLDAFVR